VVLCEKWQISRMKANLEEVIETSTVEWLKHMSCDYAQGYLCGKPLDPDAATQLITHYLATGSGPAETAHQDSPAPAEHCLI
jgi:hypothetical protein